MNTHSPNPARQVADLSRAALTSLLADTTPVQKNSGLGELSEADYRTERQVEYLTLLGQDVPAPLAARYADEHVERLRLQAWSDRQ